MKITSHELWRLELPAGRTIGDANCAYDTFECVVIRLDTSDGLRGWGYGVTCSKGVFTKPAYYIRPMPALKDLRAEVDRTWWPALKGIELDVAFENRSKPSSTLSYLDEAVRTALWDLKGQAAGQPLYRMLGGTRDRVPAYGSPLDFPLSEDVACKMSRDFVRERGFRAIKVNVGAPDVQRDIRRLRAIRDAVGPDIELTADANTMWTWQESVDRIAAYDAAGIHLGYIEDPLRFDDIEGYAHLAKEMKIDVCGHDYAPTIADLRKLLGVGGIQRLRITRAVDGAAEYQTLAKEFGVSLIGGNSTFEMGVHAACAFPETERKEFSDLAWNLLLREPVRFEKGYAIAPSRPGHGLDPRPEQLVKFSVEA